MAHDIEIRFRCRALATANKNLSYRERKRLEE